MSWQRMDLLGRTTLRSLKNSDTPLNIIALATVLQYPSPLIRMRPRVLPATARESAESAPCYNCCQVHASFTLQHFTALSLSLHP